MGCIRLSILDEQYKSCEQKMFAVKSSLTFTKSKIKVRRDYLFSFNGKERDDEIKGAGNSIAFEARIYDPRLGRFLSIDPIAPKYPMLSPYCFAANSPIRLVDVLGLGPGDVVVAFGGGDFMGTGDKGGAPTIIQKVNAQHINQAGGASRSFASQYWGVSPDNATDLDKATQGAYDFIKANHNMQDGKKVEGGKVIIEGYSMGGVMANHLAKRLGADNIQVDLLITVDAAAAWETDEVDRTISANVKENINIYQTTPSSVKSHGGANTAIDPTKTTVTNSNYTGFYNGTPGQSDYQESSHSTIDDMSQGRVIQAIVNKMGGAVLPAPKPITAPANVAPADKTRVVKPIMPIKQ
jgi:RHS repeat-associated protein